MSAQIRSLSQAEIQEFIHDANKKITYKMINHSWATSKHMPKPYCSKCGLVHLNNDLTRWAVTKGCLNSEHQGYKAAVKRYSKTKF